MGNTILVRWLIGASTVAAVGLAIPCATVWGPGGTGQPVRLTKEQAIIVWNAKTETEHFIRQAEFNTKDKDFGFIMQVPSVPKVEAVDKKAFQVLTDMVESALNPKGGAGAGGGFSGGGGFGGGGGGAPVQSVELFGQGKVGDYEYAILTGTNGEVVNTWLKENGFQSRPDLTEFFDYYVKKKWGFVAFKFVGNEEGLATTEAIRVSFKTKAPFYPYKFPKANWPVSSLRPLTVFFISDRPYQAYFMPGWKKWEAKVMWTGGLDVYRAAQVFSSCKVPRRDVPENPILTVFRNTANLSGFDKDLEFYPKN